MKITKKWLKMVPIIMAVSLTAAGCGNSNSSADSSSEQTILPSVEIATIQPETIQEYKTISSNISAKDTVSVIPKVGGTVKKVYVKVGDTVKKGDLLFEIDPSDLEMQVKSSEASIASADATINSAQAGISSAQAGLKSAQASKEMNTGSNIDKQIASLETSIKTAQMQHDELVKQLDVTKSLLEDGFASQNDVDQLQTQVNTSQSNIDLSKENLRILKEKTVSETERVSDASLDQAHASINQAQASKKQAEASKQQAQVNLDNSKKQLSYTKVVAEVSGTVNSCNVVEGGMASSASPALTIVDMDQVKIAFNVPDDLINKIKVGSQVYTTIKSLPDQEFKGSVSTASPTADDKTMLYPIEVLIQNPKHLLKPGMFATSKLILSEKANTISLPIDTVIQKDEEKYVYTIDGENTVHKVIVDTGIENDTNIEILSGLKSGDKVVVKGQDYIEDGSKVNVVTGEE